MSTPFMSSITAAATPSEFGAKRTSADSTVLPRWTQACRTLSGGSWWTLESRSIPVSPSRTISAVTPGDFPAKAVVVPPPESPPRTARPATTAASDGEDGEAGGDPEAARSEPLAPAAAGLRGRTLGHGGVGADLLHHPAAEPGRRLEPLDRLRQDQRRRAQALELAPALLAPGEVPFEVRRLGRVECSQQVGGEVVAPGVVARLAHASPSATRPLILSSPSLILPFTVPSGTLSIVAISVWLKPPK